MKTMTVRATVGALFLVSLSSAYPQVIRKPAELQRSPESIQRGTTSPTDIRRATPSAQATALQLMRTYYSASTLPRISAASAPTAR